MEMGTLEDKERYFRCNMMIGQVLAPLMRNYMQLTNVPPATVYQTIMESYCAKLRSKLSQDQMIVIQTLLTDSYEMFDITLMYKIARDKHFKMIIRETPTRRWGSSPQSTEIRIGDDIERIRRFRQTIMHKPKHIVSKSETDVFFDEFIDVGKRADAHFKTAKTSSYEQQIKDLQYCPIDPETADTLLKTQAENANLIELVKLQRLHAFMGREMEEHINEKRNGNELVKLQRLHAFMGREMEEHINEQRNGNELVKLQRLHAFMGREMEKHINEKRNGNELVKLQRISGFMGREMEEHINEKRNGNELVKLLRFPVFMGREMEENINEKRNGNEPSYRIPHIRMVITWLQNPRDLARDFLNSLHFEEILLACDCCNGKRLTTTTPYFKDSLFA